MPPVVSVIIPTYNRAHLVGRAIQSVLDQTYPEFELIVVDDASNDGTDKVVKNFNDPRIRYVRHNQNMGVAAARNTGINAAQGRYIAFQDSDDEWLPEKLDMQIKVFSNAPREVGVVYTDMWKINEGRKKYWHSPSNMPDDGIIYKRSLQRVFTIGIGTALIKRTCLSQSGIFDESFSSLEDFEFFIRISKFFCFYHIDVPLVKYHDTKNSVSKKDDAHFDAYESIFKMYQEDMDKESVAEFQFTIGNILYQRGLPDKGRFLLLSAARSCPLNKKYVVAALASLLGKGAYATICRLKRLICPLDTA